MAGGGIGGRAAALALSRQGFAVKVLEQVAEIGAGVPLGPNAFAAFDALGIGEKARSRAAYTDEMVMHDALDETLRSNDSMIFLVVEGRGEICIGAHRFELSPHDVVVVPGWMSYTLHAGDDLVLFSYSDRVAQEKLGFFRV